MLLLRTKPIMRSSGLNVSPTSSSALLVTRKALLAAEFVIEEIVGKVDQHRGLVMVEVVRATICQLLCVLCRKTAERREGCFHLCRIVERHVASPVSAFTFCNRGHVAL